MSTKEKLDGIKCRAAMTKINVAIEDNCISSCLIIVAKGRAYEARIIGDVHPLAFAINQGKEEDVIVSDKINILCNLIK